MPDGLLLHKGLLRPITPLSRDYFFMWIFFFTNILVNLNLMWVDAQNWQFTTTQLSIITLGLFETLGKLTVNSQWGFLLRSRSHVGVCAMLLIRSITPTHQYSTEGWNIPPMCDWLTQARSMNVKIHLEL